VLDFGGTIAGPGRNGDPARPGGFDPPRRARHSHIPPAQRVDLVLAVLRGTEKLEVLARRH
jgi:hypothetical protein